MKKLLGLVLLLLTACTALEVSDLEYPQPSGSYTVARTQLLLTDQSRTETFTPEPNDRRELPLHIWYPSSVKPSTRPAPWLETDWQQAFSKATGIPTNLLSRVKVNSHKDLEIASGKHPVVILSHGMTSSPLLYSATAEHLTSHGYVVVAVTHPYSAIAAVLGGGREALPLNSANAQIPDQAGLPPTEEIMALASKSERILEVWLQDITFVVGSLKQINAQRFEGRLDLERVGITGHSFGGATALRALHQLPSLKVAINLDGSLFGRLEQFKASKPVLLVNKADTPRTLGALPPDLESLRPVLEMVSTGNWKVFQNAAAPSAYAEVRGSAHNNFSDFNLLVQLLPDLADQQMGSISGDKAQRIVGDLALSFFEQHLRGRNAPLHRVAQQHPEIQLEER
jgi:hypothetical protein